MENTVHTKNAVIRFSKSSTKFSPPFLIKKASVNYLFSYFC